MTTEKIMWKTIRRLGKKPVDPRIPDPMFGAVDANYLAENTATGERRVETYSTEFGGVTKLIEIREVKKKKLP